jgi:hypothetical protein
MMLRYVETSSFMYRTRFRELGVAVVSRPLHICRYVWRSSPHVALLLVNSRTMRRSSGATVMMIEGT